MLESRMIDRKNGRLDIDIFSGDTKTYIEYCKEFQLQWSYLEKPMWNNLFCCLNLKDAQIFDIGTGTGKLYQLLTQNGVPRENILALEPNPELADYLGSTMNTYLIRGSSEDTNSWMLQNEEYDLITANMVLNHLSTRQFNKLVKNIKGMLKPGGIFVYTVPFPDGKSEKHHFRNSDNSIVVSEDAPWGGVVDYHHRSRKYQISVFEKQGFSVESESWGYEDIAGKFITDLWRQKTGKDLEGFKRFMIVAQKP